MLNGGSSRYWSICCCCCCWWRWWRWRWWFWLQVYHCILIIIIIKRFLVIFLEEKLNHQLIFLFCFFIYRDFLFRYLFRLYNISFNKSQHKSYVVYFYCWLSYCNRILCSVSVCVCVSGLCMLSHCNIQHALLYILENGVQNGQLKLPMLKQREENRRKKRYKILDFQWW